MADVANQDFVIKSYEENCIKILLKFLETHSDLQDVTILSEDGEIFKCHQFILSAVSTYFDRIFKMYKNQVKNKKNTREEVGPVLVFDEYHSKDIQSIIDFIYYGKVPIVCHSNNDSLLVLAKKWQIVGLKEILDQIPCEKVNNVSCNEQLEASKNSMNCKVQDLFRKFNNTSELEVLKIGHKLINNQKTSDLRPEEMLMQSPKYKQWLIKFNSMENET